LEKSRLVLIRGGGDLASGVAYRLYRAGLQVVITELPQPLVVRRAVSFAQAVYTGECTVEGLVGRRVRDAAEVLERLGSGEIPVLVDPEGESLIALRPLVLVDGRMTKQPPEFGMEAAMLVVGLGPGFVAGENCHAVVETHRGHTLGRVIWQGSARADTGIPEAVDRYRGERVLRAPADGPLEARAEIGQRIEAGQVVAEVAGKPVVAPFNGVLRGLVYPGVMVQSGMKIGDLDPRNDPRYCFMVSDKSLAVGGGVLEAVLSEPWMRKKLAESSSPEAPAPPWR
jgi:xanthine dehydrogenase accessory factor